MVLPSFFLSLSSLSRCVQKSVLLNRLLEEPVRLVRHSIGVLISTLAATLVPKGQWNDLLEQLLQLCQHPSESHREVAMMLFSALAENLTQTLKKYFQKLFEIFTRGLTDSSVRVRTEALTALSTLVDMLDEDEPERIAAFSSAIEPLIGVMSAHADNDDMLTAGFQVLDCLAESGTQVLDPFIPKITEFMCQIQMNNSSAPGTREKAGYLVTDIIKHKSSRLLKPNNLIPSLLQVIYRLVCEPFDDDDDELITPQLLGIEMLDAMLLNLHIPKKDVYPALMTKIGELLGSPNSDERKGGLVMMAVMAEGCGNLIIDRLSQLVPIACQACLNTPQNQSVKVRMSACVVIEQFADHLHPDISAYHEHILPTLLQVLTNPNEHDMVKEKCCSALDVFCQHLDSDIGRYITTIVPALIKVVNDPLTHVSRSAISAIKAVAYAAKEQFEPYLNECMQVVGAFLMKEDEDSLRQRCMATECIGAMGVAVGKERFCRPMSDQPGQNFYDLAFHMVIQSFALEYFELRESCYLFFADMVEMMGEDFAPRLSVVMPLVLSTLYTDDGVEIDKAKSAFNEGMASDDDDDDAEEGDFTDSDNDDGDEERHHRVIIRSGALDEKIAALNAITTIMPLVRTEDFKLYVRSTSGGAHDIFTALWELSEYPHPYIRTANVQCMRELLMWFHRAVPPSKQWSQGENVPLESSIKEMVEELTRLIVERMDEEDDRQCAAEACDALGEVLQKYGTIILQQTITVGDKNRREVPLPTHILDLIIRFLQEKAPSQIPEEVEDESERTEIEDHDFVLMESVSDLITILAEVMGASFEPGFRLMFPHIQRFFKPDKQAPTKAMSIGLIAEVVHWLTAAGQASHPLEPYFATFIQYATQCLADPSPLVRRNASFCTGSLALISSPTILAAYPSFIPLLGAVYTPPTGPVDPNAGIVNGSLKDEEFLGARDNACSAISKMMMTAPQATGLSMANLIEMVLSGLPLECDFNEAKYVYPAVMNLYRTHPGEITPHTQRVVSIFARVFGNPDIDTNVQKDMIAFCKELVRQAPSVTQITRICNHKSRTMATNGIAITTIVALCVLMLIRSSFCFLTCRFSRRNF